MPPRREAPAKPLRLVAAVGQAGLERALERSSASRWVATLRGALQLEDWKGPGLAEGIVLAWHFVQDPAACIAGLPPEWALLLLTDLPGRLAARQIHALARRPRTLLAGPWLTRAGLERAVHRLAVMTASGTAGSR